MTPLERLASAWFDLLSPIWDGRVRRAVEWINVRVQK